MSSFARAVVFGTALLAVITWMVGNNTNRRHARQGVKAQEEIVKLAEKLAAGKDISDDVAALKKKIEGSGPIMHSYKPGNKGGIGYGPKKEGIELNYNGMGKRAVAAKALKDEKDALVKLAYINAAIADIAAHLRRRSRRAARGRRSGSSTRRTRRRRRWNWSRRFRPVTARR